MKRGFSLIELLAALAVLTIGLLGSVQLYHFGLDRMRTARESAAAVRAVRNEMEWLRAQPFAALDATPKDAFAAGDADLAGLLNAKPRVTVEPYPGAETRLRKVTVALAWTGENGRTVTKSFDTLIAAKEAP